MFADRAVKVYQSHTHNCAQSVLKGAQAALPVSEEQIAQARAHGGGRAPEGLCGALHAAISLVDDKEQAKKMRQQFVDAAGSENCRKIRQAGTFSCAECVKTAASLLQKELAQNPRTDQPS